MNTVIFTSIAPGSFERQSRAVASWLKLGFRVVSVNSPEECAQLAERYPQIRFMETPRSAADRLGKPLVYLDDVLAAVGKPVGKPGPVAGIVNSDVILDAQPHVVERIRSRAADAFVFGSRVDVTNEDARSGRVFRDGYDYFFFPTNLAARVPQSPFCLGAPWWDYWIVFAAKGCGLPVFRLTDRVAFHVLHDLGWNADWYRELGIELLRLLGMGGNKTEALETMRRDEARKVLTAVARNLRDAIEKEPVLSLRSS